MGLVWSAVSRIVIQLLGQFASRWHGLSLRFLGRDPVNIYFSVLGGYNLLSLHM